MPKAKARTAQAASVAYPRFQQSQPAVADQAAVGLQADGEESVAVLALVEVALQPTVHLLPVERCLPERGHHRRVAEDPHEVVQVSGDHRTQQEPFRL